MKRNKSKVKLGLHGQTDNAIVELARRILTAMTGNPKFTAPLPGLAEFAAQLTDASARVQAFHEAESTYKSALIARRDAMAKLCDMLTRLGLYVENVSGGDAAIIISAGLHMRAERLPVTMSQVEGLGVTPSQREGELLAHWKRVPGARVYRVQVNADPAMAPANWLDVLTCTKTKCALNHDLVSGQKVGVRVCAVGARNKGAWSNVLWRTVP